MELNLKLTIFMAFALMFAFLIRALVRPKCTCETCNSYLTMRWAKEYNNLCDWYTHLLSTSPTGTIHVHVINNVITSNPKNVEHILKTKFDNYPKGEPFSAILGDLLGRGIFNADGDSWRLQRRTAVHALGRGASVRALVLDAVGSVVESRLVPLLAGRAAVELQDVFRRFAFDVTCRVSFGFDPGCLSPALEECGFAAAFDLASKLSAERAVTPFPFVWKVKRFFGLGSEGRLKEAIRTVHGLADAIIRDRRRSGRNNGARDDLLSLFIATAEEDGGSFLRDVVVSFLLAGRDTVSSALVAFFWLLSQNPTAARRIREELGRVMGHGPDRAVAGFSELREMHYLHAAVHESMRLFPPVQFDSKFCKEDDILPAGGGAAFVPRGTRVTYHPYAMGRMAGIWGDDCLEFRPERWLGPDGVFRRADPYKYPVFQAGPRVCLGMEMALLEIKAVAVTLVRMFDFEVVSGEGIRFGPGLTATVRGGLPVIVRRRNTT